MKVEISSLCEIGLVRPQNQDSILVYRDDAHAFYLCLVADGMGGHENGALASRAITQGVEAWLPQAGALREGGQIVPVLSAVRDQMQEINGCILETWGRTGICGSTCAALLLLGNAYGVFSVGDSRVYRRRGLSFEQLTRDDVWENQDRVRAQLSEEEIRRHPNYGKLVRAVGVQTPLEYSMQTDRLKKGDVFALCSDGVYKMCDARFLAKAVGSAWRSGLDAVCGKIREEVYRNAAKDNLSLILLRYR